MRTTIDVDDLLLRYAMNVTGLQSKAATVEEALRGLIQSRLRAQAVADLAGIGWDGDLNLSRRDSQVDLQS